MVGGWDCLVLVRFNVRCTNEMVYALDVEVGARLLDEGAEEGEAVGGHAGEEVVLDLLIVGWCGRGCVWVRRAKNGFGWHDACAPIKIQRPAASTLHTQTKSKPTCRLYPWDATAHSREPGAKLAAPSTFRCAHPTSAYVRVRALVVCVCVFGLGWGSVHVCDASRNISYRSVQGRTSKRRTESIHHPLTLKNHGPTYLATACLAALGPVRHGGKHPEQEARGGEVDEEGQQPVQLFWGCGVMVGGWAMG